jgi:hypothetical protein
MATTQNTYTGNGSTVLYSFTFPYLENTAIKVSLNGVITTAYTLANATTIQFTTAPANGAAIRIFRVTDDATLAATFYPGSSIRSQDLNENFTQNLYVTQESNRDATTATSTAEGAVTTANTALSNSTAATSTANTASANASAAVSTANTASSNASAAVSTANTASSNASAAVSTANTASSNASAAVSTANSAASTANSAVSTANAATATANTALGDAATAISTANTAASNATTAISTANAATSTANTALSTANAASSAAAAAVVTADLADDKADQAIAAVSAAVLFDLITDVAGIPATPDDQDFIEISNSTGIESFTPLVGLPGGFIGDSGLTVRLVYQDSNNSWNWLSYFSNDPEDRYAPINNASLTGTTLADIIGVAQTVRFSDSDASHYVALQAPSTVAANLTFTLPDTDGSVGQYLRTNGSGLLSWASDQVITLIDGGNFDNGSSTVSTAQTIDGGQF